MKATEATLRGIQQRAREAGFGGGPSYNIVVPGMGWWEIEKDDLRNPPKARAYIRRMGETLGLGLGEITAADFVAQRIL